MSLFCRHNRLTSNCPICSREQQAELRSKAPPSPPRTRSSSSSGAKRRSGSTGRTSGVVTRRVARVGIYFLMVSFGAAFGFTVMGRVALLIGRLNFLILNWIYPLFGIK